MMMPTTLATRSRKESKLKEISRSERRRRRYIVRPRFSWGQVFTLPVSHGQVEKLPPRRVSIPVDGRSLLRGDAVQGGIGHVERTQPVAMHHKTDHGTERRV